uniref:Uncharacterized protein n=1 Tax=Anguilla anguilla TaxID=7936 RepID=A0A0E9XK75_ANGAN
MKGYRKFSTQLDCIQFWLLLRGSFEKIFFLVLVGIPIYSSQCRRGNNNVSIEIPKDTPKIILEKSFEYVYMQFSPYELRACIQLCVYCSHRALVAMISCSFTSVWMLNIFLEQLSNLWNQVEAAV